MEHLYNTIRPVGKRVIVAVKSGEKNSHIIKGPDGKDIELYVDTSHSWDGRVSGSTQATLLTDFKNLKAGTRVLIHHNTIQPENQLDVQPNPSTSIHAIDEDTVYFGINGDDIICLDGYMIVERIFEEDDVTPGGIILTEKKKNDVMMKIINKPDSITDYEVGDIAVVYKYSDYEIPHNIGGKSTKVIRLKYSDCIGKVNQDV
jgi:co-chaperonin GroES (HSP10)